MTMRLPFAARRRLARLGVLTGTLLGLFAMHGLGDHGTMHRAVHVPAAVESPPLGHQTTWDHAQPTKANRFDTHGDERHDGPVGAAGMLGLCLAVLGLVWATARGATGRGLIVPELRRRIAGRAARRPALRCDRDPPCLFQLSIQRC